ncbi:putative fluoride ion transporter CrcB [Alsobacter metallidurans]|uniref:Fluoride-specific ion channel FluC n=1 Tax=Alsobacter metallidurans TaxID=340221 RepID=A0A917MKR5_9HYPH|nr:fluoride efflux transporter CrcB [Alsobacter metallidurans]GGH25289.1 putative fluoride ion transporter CrcB [Alsobacter metallidurans]
MQSTLLVFLGGGIGAAMRHGVNMAVTRVAGTAFPWHTLLINVAGSTAMGLLIGWLAFRADASWSQPARLFLTTGICGGFTTFSAFSLDAVFLWERGAGGAAAAYVGASVILSILGLAGGLALVRSFT